MMKLEAERVILREWKEEDVEPFAKINQDPKVMEFMPKLLTKQEVNEWIERIKLHFKNNNFGMFACELKETKKFIGYIGLQNVAFEASFTPCVEVAWRLASDHWGKGLATEGAKRVLEFAFNDLKLKEVLAFTVPKNLPSRRVMEKLGMTHDPKENFNHPKLPLEHPLSLHVLYRIKEDFFNKP
ncbi:MAG: GNAT family N-acetyltransferase [Sphingobacteriia bacterium]|nr:GNAT family N-acetyltransferase [Sphingobacteriia bacterium]